MPVSYSWFTTGMYTGSIQVPASYSWNLVGNEITGALPPNPGPGIQAIPLFGEQKSTQFARTIKFGNVPGGRASNAVVNNNGPWHVNCVSYSSNAITSQDPHDTHSDGAIKFRFNRRTKSKTPNSIIGIDPNGVDYFGNPVYSWSGTGSYVPPIIYM